MFAIAGRCVENDDARVLTSPGGRLRGCDCANAGEQKKRANVTKNKVVSTGNRQIAILFTASFFSVHDMAARY